jgi:hypothetical protein
VTRTEVRPEADSCAICNVTENYSTMNEVREGLLRDGSSIQHTNHGPTMRCLLLWSMVEHIGLYDSKISGSTVHHCIGPVPVAKGPRW